MSKKNLPNIPIYIGDWERDCNVLSLESEMAWMKVIFKMHLNGKSSTYKTSAKALQILWKVEFCRIEEIINELQFNDICQIDVIEGGYLFTSRRLLKENDVSKTRSDAAKTRYSGDSCKTPANDMQNSDIDYEDNSINNKEGNENSTFDFVWVLYDKKVGDKVKLKKKWDALKEEEQQRAFAHIEQYKLAQPDKSFRKNFETYLNNKSFNDEIINGVNSQAGRSNNSQRQAGKSTYYASESKGMPPEQNRQDDDGVDGSGAYEVVQ